MSIRHPIPLCATAALVLFLGCEPPPEREDPIAETMRMLEAARRSGQAGKSRNVFVSVERIQVSAGKAGGLASLWSYTSGRLTIRGSNGLAAGGVRLGAANDKFAAKLAAYASKADHTSRTSESISVYSGREGFLWVGRSVVVPVLRIATSSGETVVLRRARVGAALRVRPRILEDGKIELELEPYFSVLDGGRGGRGGRSYSVAAMRTRVVVSPGQKLVLGSSSSSKEGSVAAGLFGYNSSGEKTVTLITVSAERL